MEGPQSTGAAAGVGWGCTRVSAEEGGGVGGGGQEGTRIGIVGIGGLGTCAIKVPQAHPRGGQGRGRGHGEVGCCLARRLAG